MKRLDMGGFDPRGGEQEKHCKKHETLRRFQQEMLASVWGRGFLPVRMTKVHVVS